MDDDYDQFDDYDQSDERWHPYDDEPLDEGVAPIIDGVGFADPGGRSALRAATRDNPRDQPCPTCKAENVLTRIDRQRHYQCDRCADRAEGRMGSDY